jgi:hypothetical protein
MKTIILILLLSGMWFFLGYLFGINSKEKNHENILKRRV